MLLPRDATLVVCRQPLKRYTHSIESTPDLVAAMKRLQDDPGYRDRLGQAGRDAFLAHWSEEAVVPRYLDIVRRTAERTGRTAIVDALSMAEVM